MLLLRLAGPMQAWGDSSRFTRRNTRKEPTKSGVIGLLAAAQGRSREDDIEDLVRLEYGVRVDQPGRIIRDFQTERSEDSKAVMPLSNRYYLSDAVFLVALSASEEVLLSLDAALRSPRWPLYLGRRACPASLPITLGVRQEYSNVRQALSAEPWQADSWYRKRHSPLRLSVACDAQEGESFESQSDLPLTFSIENRRYASRLVHHFEVDNPSLPSVPEQVTGPGAFGEVDGFDPMSF
ncbi:CRISPR-associated protein, Cas5e family [Bifidobacterium actinocoloniiforme DSM 22766]|uniref:CRISPR-associated protein, Cas5e family n=1 Tax=Bifidobacterium actinocoloniiforme DSM 22766 TaxID=1437605 RepID=A0A086YYJ1_9BIFI|nr:CRISPR-associated protein, Cas5e family [Bifidobacterium actinocoloniiforme DSM 22766]